MPNHIIFDGDSSYIDCGDPSILGSLTHLSKSPTSYEFWIYPTYDGAAKDEYVWCKGNDRNWIVINDRHVKCRARVTSGTDPLSLSSTQLELNAWTHVFCSYDDNGTRKWRIFFNGTEASYTTQDAGAGSILGDATRDFHIGADTNLGFYFEGWLGWLRISDVFRWTSDFTPPTRCALPNIDANTIAQWIGTEDDPITTVDNQEGTSDADGVPTDCVWDDGCIGVDIPGTLVSNVMMGAV